MERTFSVKLIDGDNNNRFLCYKSFPYGEFFEAGEPMQLGIYMWTVNHIKPFDEPDVFGYDDVLLTIQLTNCARM